MPPPSTLSNHGKAIIDRIKSGKTKQIGSGDILNPYWKAARWIGPAINPFVSISDVFYRGIKNGTEPTTSETCRAYQKILEMVPTLDDVISAMSDNESEDLELLISYFETTCNTARQEDTNSIKYSISEYLLPRPATDEWSGPVLSNALPKSSRGFNHPVTARFLVPYSMFDKFEKDPDLFMKQVLEGKIKIDADEMPSFMYDVCIPYNANDLQKGLCRGYVLHRAIRHILTGASSAITGHRTASKPSKAQIHRLTHVSGRTIAYVAVLVRMALSSAEKWTRWDAEFDYKTYFNRVVRMFERDPEDPWVVETLEYINQQVPDLDRPSKKRKKGRQQTNTDDDGSGSDDEFMSRVLAQRKAKRQAIEAGWEVESNDGNAIDLQDDNQDPPTVKQGKQDSRPRPRECDDDPAGDENNYDNHQGKKDAFNVQDGQIPPCRVPLFLPTKQTIRTGHDLEAHLASDNKDDHQEQDVPASPPGAKRTTRTSRTDTVKQVAQPSLSAKQMTQVIRNTTAKPVPPSPPAKLQTTNTIRNDTPKEVPQSLPAKQTSQTSWNDTTMPKSNKPRAPSEALSELTAVDDEIEISCTSRSSRGTRGIRRGRGRGRTKRGRK